LNATSILNASNRFANFAAAIGALSQVVALGISVAEQLSPNTNGASKFNAVLDTAKNFMVSVGNDVAVVEQLVPTLAAGINTAVEAYKGRIVQNPTNGAWVPTPVSPTPSA